MHHDRSIDELDRRFQPALANEAPGADDVGYDIDNDRRGHDGGLAGLTKLIWPTEAPGAIARRFAMAP